MAKLLPREQRVRTRYRDRVRRAWHPIKLLAKQPLWTVALPTLWARIKLCALHVVVVTVPSVLRIFAYAIRSAVVDYVLCCFDSHAAAAAAQQHRKKNSGDDVRGFRTSSTAFVTFARPVSRLLALHTTLTGQPFGMYATPAPEGRDVIWENVHEAVSAIDRRRRLVNGILVIQLFCWTFIVAAASNADKLGKWFPESNVRVWVESLAPAAALLAVINILPLIFQAVGRFYERRKSISNVDMAVVTRFFKFQAVNVYVSVFATALLTQFEQAWQNPGKFVILLGQKMPASSLFLAKFLALNAGTSPLWCLRVWPLISRGWKTWTLRPPELPGVLYGWALPKLNMSFTIVSTFWCFSPLTSVIGLVYFACVSVFFRYNILFVHMPFYETGGVFFELVVQRILFGLGVSNCILLFWFLTKYGLFFFFVAHLTFSD